MGKPKAHGRYCWSCDRRRANERFSGKGHARCLCRDCEKLGAEELAYRQAMNVLEECVTDEGLIRRKRRTQFLQFLEHSNPRVRQRALEIQQEDIEIREELRLEQEESDRQSEDPDDASVPF